jgi:hypothetical protein
LGVKEQAMGEVGQKANVPFALGMRVVRDEMNDEFIKALYVPISFNVVLPKAEQTLF